jgi:hypothetical protein
MSFLISGFLRSVSRDFLPFFLLPTCPSLFYPAKSFFKFSLKFVEIFKFEATEVVRPELAYIVNNICSPWFYIPPLELFTLIVSVYPESCSQKKFDRCFSAAVNSWEGEGVGGGGRAQHGGSTRESNISSSSLHEKLPPCLLAHILVEDPYMHEYL